MANSWPGEESGARKYTTACGKEVLASVSKLQVHVCSILVNLSVRPHWYKRTPYSTSVAPFLTTTIGASSSIVASKRKSSTCSYTSASLCWLATFGSRFEDPRLRLRLFFDFVDLRSLPSSMSLYSLSLEAEEEELFFLLDDLDLDLRLDPFRSLSRCVASMV